MNHHPDVERRLHARIETALPVRCETSSQIDEAAIALDLSLTGAQILVNKNQTFDGPIELEIELDRQSRILLRANAVWSSDVDDYNALLGVRFGGLDSRAQQDSLNDWLDENGRFTALLHDYCVEAEIESYL